MSDTVLLVRAVYAIFGSLLAIPLNGFGWTWNVRCGVHCHGNGIAGLLSYYGFLCDCGLSERKGLGRMM